MDSLSKELLEAQKELSVIREEQRNGNFKLFSEKERKARQRVIRASNAIDEKSRKKKEESVGHS